MLSILVPIYNFYVEDFIKDLHRLATLASIPFEIRCYDDESKAAYKEVNRSIEQISNVVYKELPQNLGRAKIRNKLAAEAQYEYLLFVDCDSKIVTEDYLTQYLEICEKRLVIYGGRSYEKDPPREHDRYFRWYYGKKRESISARRRLSKPYKSFMTNNFFIHRSLYQTIKLDESISGYGHEDTLFGVHLKNMKVPILHLDNPLCHIGLEGFDEYMDKTHEALRNLKRLIEDNKVDEDVSLYKFYMKAKSLRLNNQIAKIFTAKKDIILHRLRKIPPNLLLFDFYKLGYLASLEQGQNKI